MGEAARFSERSEIEELLDSVDQKFNGFKNFEVDPILPSDHHFITHSSPFSKLFLCPSSRQKEDAELRRRIQKEWYILRDKLPKSIYVRAYDGRKDLMRAAIIGLTGTPNAYCLFFFDIYIPRGYPSKPPIMFLHHNHSQFVWNPTLLISNIFKLKWDPQSSSIYQVLEFIQGFDLRFSKIYAKGDGKDYLIAYNTLLGILRSPPMGFEDFVRGYFRKYSHAILLNFKLKEDLSVCQTRNELFFKMVEAFEANGSYCEHQVYGVKRIISSTPQQQQIIDDKKTSQG